jgi:hypothetical protein
VAVAVARDAGEVAVDAVHGLGQPRGEGRQLA